MTLEDLEQQAAEIQTQLNELGMDLIRKNAQGVKLLTQRELIVIRIENGDYDFEIPKSIDAPIGDKVIDNDA
jgi:hypothetical protein